MSPALAWLLKIAAALFALYVVIGASIMIGQRRLIYLPYRERIAPEAVGLAGVEEVRLEVAPGVRVLAWFRAAEPGRPTLLYFHGNAGSIATRAERMREHIERGNGIMLLSYRGYGGSAGSPSEAANVADGGHAYEWLLARGVAPEQLVIFGESLGTGVAVQVAARRPVAGVILDSPFTSLVDMAARLYPWLPVGPFVWDRYDVATHVASLEAPVLVLHGEADEIVPVEMGRAVHRAAGPTAELATFPGARHLDHDRLGSFAIIDDWLQRKVVARQTLSGRP